MWIEPCGCFSDAILATSNQTVIVKAGSNLHDASCLSRVATAVLFMSLIGGI